ncbi:MAG: hypothetical protein HY542_01635 [Deltaproteobacteria bacterium]|nr:hypothetical protein [Deltaproteobacteria bacterium]
MPESPGAVSLQGINPAEIVKRPNLAQGFKSLRFTPFHQVTSWNYPVPLKVKVSVAEAYDHKISAIKLDGYEVDFFAQKNGGEPTWIGTAITDAEGFATVYYKSTDSEEVTITHRLKSDPNGQTTFAGKLYRLSPEKPVVAVDLDDLLRHGGWGKVDELIRAIRQEGYQPVLLVNTINNASTYERVAKRLQSRGLPVLYNDIRYSGFHPDHRGFGEAQLEKLKRLKFEGGVPIVAVYGRAVKNEAAYRRSDLTLFSWKDKLKDRKTELQGSLIRFRQLVTRPDFDIETFSWDGLTDSSWQEGNQFQFYFDPQEALQELLSLIARAETFLSIRNASHLLDDPVGKRIKMQILERTRPDPRRPPLKIRMMMDGVLGNLIFLSNPGITWASDRDVKILKEMGVDYVTVPVDHHIDQDEPFFGIGTRHHTKFTIADIGGKAVAFGGGRHFSSASFDDRIPPPEGVTLVERLAGMHKGGFRDLSFTVRGPIVRTIHRSFLDDFEANGGLPDGKTGKPIEGKDRLLSPGLYAPSLDPANSTPARFISHHSYQDQNCLNVLFRFLEGPDSRQVTLVNSFIPSGEMIEAMKLAARSGKDVRWIAGSIANLYDWIRDPRLEQLLDAGVRIFVVPERLHTKLYGQDRYYAFGNHNLDGLSLKDDEDLTLVPKKSPAGRELDQYIDSLLARATPLHVGWRRGEGLSKMLDRAQTMGKPTSDQISTEEKPHTSGAVLNHVALTALDFGQTMVTGVTREVFNGRFAPPIRGTLLYLDGRAGGGIDVSFGNIGEHYVAKPKPNWRTFFLNQYALEFGLYFYDENFMTTGRFKNRSAPIQLRWGEAAPQISWEQYVGLTAAESLENRLGVRFQSGNHLNLQGERLGGRLGMHGGNKFRYPAPSFDPVTIDPVIMSPDSFYFSLDANASFEGERSRFSVGPFTTFAPYSEDQSYGLSAKLKWYAAYPRDEILTLKASVQRTEEEARGLLLLEMPLNLP